MCEGNGAARAGRSGAAAWLAIRCPFQKAVLVDADNAGAEGAARLVPVLEALRAKVLCLVPEVAKDLERDAGTKGKRCTA